MIDSTFKGHEIWKALDEADKALERETHNEFSLSLLKLFEYFRWILESSDPAFVAPQELDALVVEIRNASGIITTSEVTKQNYNNSLQHLTPSLAKFPYPRIKRIFRSEANEVISQIEAESLQLQATLSQLQADVTVAMQQAKETRHDLETVAVDAHVARSDVHSLVSQLESANSASLSATIAELRTEFTNEKNSRSERFQDEVNSRKEQLANLKADAESISAKTDKELEQIRSLQVQKLDEFQKMAQERYSDIDKLFQEAGQTVLAGGFAQAAISEKGRYESDSRYAKVAFGFAALALAILAGSDLWKGSFTWLEALYKLPISLVLAAPGIYFAGLASKHRREANRLRSLGLRIGAFDSFLRSATAEEATLLRSSIAPHFFSDGMGGTGEESGDLVSDKFLDAFGKIAEKLPKLGK